MYIKPDEMVQPVAQVAYPDYNGRKFKVEIANTPLNMASYWSGGSRDFWMGLMRGTSKPNGRTSEPLYILAWARTG